MSLAGFLPDPPSTEEAKPEAPDPLAGHVVWHRHDGRVVKVGEISRDQEAAGVTAAFAASCPVTIRAGHAFGDYPGDYDVPFDEHEE